jgi:hypothetical protein
VRCSKLLDRVGIIRTQADVPRGEQPGCQGDELIARVAIWIAVSLPVASQLHDGFWVQALWHSGLWCCRLAVALDRETWARSVD